MSLVIGPRSQKLGGFGPLSQPSIGKQNMGALLPKLGLAAIAALAISGSANAAVSITGFDQFGLAAPANQHLVDSFDAPAAAGFSVNLGTNGQIVSGTVTDVHQAPFGDASQYLAVLRDPSAVVTLMTPSTITDLSFYVGSIDTYNSVKFYNTANALVTAFTGSQLQAAALASLNGNNEHGRFFFDLTGQNIGSVTFGSTQNAFEIDNIAANVPEPGVWAMMLLGMGGLGYALRRRRFAVSGAATA
jgi:hypothetical protein